MATAQLQPSTEDQQNDWASLRLEDVGTPVETDPTQRYFRYPVLLGKGACKRVYKAFDRQEGLEVAWNQVELMGNNLEEEQRERLFAEIRVLKQLRHRNIMTFYDWWYDPAHQTINFITEYFTSGTLRQYRKKHKHISETAIKRWAAQILEGLVYLHAHDPAIVHRDLKCDNILVNGTIGQVKIADLGLASCHRGLSVVGTPEFMAPEIYDEVYDEKVDIYSFGMCMLELATLEYPYSECRSIPAIFRKVSQGIPPQGLGRVAGEELREFISLCIAFDPAQRPSAMQLLKHSFFDTLRSDTSCTSPTHWNVPSAYFSRAPSSFCMSLGRKPSAATGSTARTSVAGAMLPPCPPSAAAAGRRSMPGYLEAGRAAGGAAGPGAAGGEGGGAMAGSRSGSGNKLHSSDAGVVRSSTSSAAADKEPLNKGRGCTICVAALSELNGSSDSEDSDEEIIVPLEAVLHPHPMDTVDEAAAMCPAAAAAAAAVTAAAASHHSHMGATELLDVDFGPTPSLLSRLASLATAGGSSAVGSIAHGGGCSALLTAATSARSAANSITHSGAAVAAAAAAAGGWGNNGSMTAQAAAAAAHVRSSGGGAAQMVGAAWAAAAAASHTSSSSTAAGPAEVGRPPSGASRAAAAAAAAAAGSGGPGGDAEGRGVAAGPGCSVLVRCISNRALPPPVPSAAGGLGPNGGPSSTSGGAGVGAAGAAAMAGPAAAAVSVLCLPGGQIVPMSPMLEKLIHHRRNTSENWSSWDAVVLVPTPGLHHESNLGLNSIPIATASEAAAVPVVGSPRALARHISALPPEGWLATGKAVEAGEAALSAQLPGWSILPAGSISSSSQGILGPPESEVAAAATAAAAAAAAGAGPGAAAVLVQALQSPAAGMGRIVVRRKFARNICPSLGIIKRSATL